MGEGNLAIEVTPAEKVWPAIVIGAGPSGLAASYELKRRGIDHVVLERAEVGHVWANLYDSLTLHSGRHMSGLPGMPIPRSAPLFVPRATFLSYLRDYARANALPIRTGVEVTAVTRDEPGWRLATSDGPLLAGALIVATGIASTPYRPDFPDEDLFAGAIMHTAAYRRPADVPGHSVLVVGIGNSGAEIGAELAEAGRAVDVAVRSGATIVPLKLFGMPIQYFAYYLLKLPKPLQLLVTGGVKKFVELRRGPSPLPPSSADPLESVPIIGFRLFDAIKAGKARVRPGVVRFTETGVVFSDGSIGAYDTVLLATGYRAALEPLGALVTRDAHGFARRSDLVTSAEQENLYFVGHNHTAAGGIRNIYRDAGIAAEGVARAVATSSRRQ